MRRLPDELLDNAKTLFWDVDPDSLDAEQHRDFILGRVLTFGNETAVRSVLRQYGRQVAGEFVARAAHRLDKRSRRFFEVVLNVSDESCNKTLFYRNKDALFSR